MSYLIKFLQTNPKRIVINDRMYEPYQYGGIIPLYCAEIPKEMELIIKWDKGEKVEPNTITNWLNNVVGIDRRCTLIIELYEKKRNNVLLFKKEF